MLRTKKCCFRLAAIILDGVNKITIPLPRGKSNMPSKINLYQIGVWFCVGLAFDTFDNRAD